MALIEHLLSFLAVVGTIQASTIDVSVPCRITPLFWDLSLSVTRKPPPPPPGPDCQRRVCYFTNWSQDGAGFPPKDFDASLCTHIIFSRARIQEIPANPFFNMGKYWDLEIDPLNKQQVKSLKKTNPDLKVLVPVDVQASVRMIRAMVDKAGGFSNNPYWWVIRLGIKRMWEWEVDGLDWYFPASSKISDQDKIYISQLMKDMKKGFKQNAKDCLYEKGLLMTATLPADKATVNSGFDIPTLSRDLDFVNLMTFDSPEDSDVKWRHISPLFGEAENTREHNVDFYANNWIEKGFPKDKIVIGIPAYGSSFSMAHVTHDFVTYNKVCEMIQDGAWVKRLPKEKVPTINHDSKLVFYDDPQSVATKVKYVKAKGYGGVMVRSLDDFNTTACHTGKYPLLNALKQECSKVLPK